MKTLHISDTHGMHRELKVPTDIDCIIHSGDSTNQKSLVDNLIEFEDFFDWFKKLKVKHKIIIAGNHDAWATKLYNKELLKENGIHYLEDSSVVIENIKFYGSPWSPTMNDWYFMKRRDKLFQVWEAIPEDTNVLITHTPPKGVLDLSFDRQNTLEFCGCSFLMKKINQLKHLSIHMFGHIHNFKECINSGTLHQANSNTIFSNATCVTDGKFAFGLTSHGNIFTI